MQKAGDSDQGVLKRLADNEAAFAALGVEAAAAQMPRLQVGGGTGTWGNVSAVHGRQESASAHV